MKKLLGLMFGLSLMLLISCGSSDQQREIQIITEYGTMTAVLYNETPGHRDNFIKLAKDGFFDDLLFHRVINGFMIQGGDPESKDAPPTKMLGNGGPGYTLPAEFNDEFIHVKGALAAARQGDNVNPKRKSSGSQFYVIHGKPVNEQFLSQIETQQNFKYTPEQKQDYYDLQGAPHLDRQYTVFGQVIDGLDVIDKIAAVKTATANRPAKDIKMTIKVTK